eukprot:TRINITY_DN5254_c8_g1_i1.p1 TRINITY_DN5254_c8_g1~~TRINITY_DN5254_c8_g1_i1.p1  ORF type:complete len:383 (-),score=109.01 TRINITY_DN5254_c8_g1_i1:330-1478(-)
MAPKWTAAAAAAVLSALQISVSSATLMTRSQATMGSGVGFGGSACDCSKCIGEERLTSGSGGLGYQCYANTESVQCDQQGLQDSWVVQSAKTINWDRFCLYTCKPVMSSVIKAEVPCIRLTKEEVKLNGQSISYNGKDIVYKANPMAPVLPLSSMVGTEGTGGLGGDGPIDPVMQMRGAFQEVRAEGVRTGLAKEEAQVPVDFVGPPPCICHCGKPPGVNRFRKSAREADDPIYPKPVEKFPAAPDMVEPLEPPMPPPPPAMLPPPARPLGLGPLAVLPSLPTNPVEVTGLLDLEKWPGDVGVPYPAPPAAAPAAELAGPSPSAGLLQFSEPTMGSGITRARPSLRTLSFVQEEAVSAPASAPAAEEKKEMAVTGPTCNCVC